MNLQDLPPTPLSLDLPLDAQEGETVVVVITGVVTSMEPLTLNVDAVGSASIEARPEAEAEPQEAALGFPEEGAI